MTVRQMADDLGFCRDRFYELITAGIFPPPAYHLQTRRPFYPSELQAVCHRIRSGGTGFGGQTVLFNQTRRSRSVRSGGQTPAAMAGPRPEPARLIDQLAALGVQG
jgi:hypothetical protein